MTLEVPGRKSGKVTAFPPGMADVDGRWYLVSMLGECNWVANVRAADGYAIPGAVRRDRSRWRAHIPISEGSSLEEFADVAESYPVFEVLDDRRG